MLTDGSLKIISLGYFCSDSDTFSCATEIKIPVEKGCHTGSLFITHHKCQRFLLSYRGPKPWEEEKKKKKNYHRKTKQELERKADTGKFISEMKQQLYQDDHYWNKLTYDVGIGCPSLSLQSTDGCPSQRQALAAQSTQTST